MTFRFRQTPRLGMGRGNWQGPGKYASVPAIGFPLGFDKNSPVLEGPNYCSISLGKAPTQPTEEELIELAYDIVNDPGITTEEGASGGNETVTVGNSTYPSLPIVRRGAVVIFTAPGKQECYGTPGNIGNTILNTEDHINAKRYANYKGSNTGKELIVDNNLLHKVAQRCAEGVRAGFLGNVRIVDRHGKLGMDTFQGPEFTYPDDGSIWCNKHGSANKFCGSNSNENSTKMYAVNLINSDSRFDEYNYIYIINLGCWNTFIGGGFRRTDLPTGGNIPSTNPNDSYRLFIYSDVGQSFVPGGEPGMGWSPPCIHPHGNVGVFTLNPDMSAWDPDSWNWPSNLWDLKYFDEDGYWYGMWLHELGHGSSPAHDSPNWGKIGGFKHEQMINQMGDVPQLNTLPCVFADTGPMDREGNCGGYDPGNTTAGMNYHNMMSYAVSNKLTCHECTVPCPDPGTGGIGPGTPYGLDTGWNTSYLHFADFIPDENVFDLTPVPQGTPGEVIFEDWLWASDIIHILPEMQSLGGRKVLIKQEMQTDLPYPSDWDTVVPQPKKRFMSLCYHARGYIEKYATRSVIDSPDGVIYLNWGPQEDIMAGTFADCPTYARINVSPGNPASPLIIHGFATTYNQSPGSRFHGWKIETVGFAPGPVGGKIKVKIKITSLGE